jgi:hypothetical protein
MWIELPIQSSVFSVCTQWIRRTFSLFMLFAEDKLSFMNVRTSAMRFGEKKTADDTLSAVRNRTTPGEVKLAR